MSEEIQDLTEVVAERFERLIAAAPDDEPATTTKEPPPRNVASITGIPARYREEWPRPIAIAWNATFGKIMAVIANGGTIAMIGPRGTGKTRFAAEAMRNVAPREGIYATAMGVFIRIRETFQKNSKESESEIVRELSRCPLLILDEIQERGNSAWEDRLLTHILDARYGNMLPTIIIANLTSEALAVQLGDSIVSRLHETGGVLEINGPSHRIKQPTLGI